MKKRGWEGIPEPQEAPEGQSGISESELNDIEHMKAIITTLETRLRLLEASFYHHEAGHLDRIIGN